MSGFTAPGSRPDDDPGRQAWQPPSDGASGAPDEQNMPTQPEQPGHPGPWSAADGPGSGGQSGQPGPSGQPAPPPEQPPHPGPYGQPGPAGQPPAYGAQPPGGGPGGPYGPGDGPAGPSGPSGSGGSGPGKGVVLGIIGGVVGLVIIAVVILVLLIGQGDDEPEAGGGAAGDGEAEEVGGGDAEGAEGADGAASAPDSAVEAYLAALADGDAETALSLIEEPSDTTFLTDEVLSASLESAPISGVEVTPVDAGENDYAKEVTASYSVGEEDVTQRFQVYNEDGSWNLEGAASLSLPDAGELPLTINGVEASTDDAYVFMGAAYTLDVDHENFMLDGGEQLLADDTFLSTADATVALSESGLKSWRQVVSDAVDECVASSDREAGCGLDVGQRVQGYDVVEGSIERSLNSSVEQEISTIEPQLDWSSPNLASSYISGSATVTAQIRTGGGTQRHEILGDPSYFADPVVDMTADQLSVTWE